ncbi:hypothetical protein [Candidatus Amarobacter glycogenicus]|uniref:hypothetical protein n=1 Tax=Candidatus Amarobacter glycogenicus TaxID=3140699 RepID=UPI002A102233|nr:hypothetical protein [Dehalococcoidia bacterium]
MNLFSGFVAALLATVAVAGVDYGLLPVGAIAAHYLGLVTFPASLDFLASPPAAAAALGLAGLSTASRAFGRPRSLHRLERLAGIPASSLAILAIALGAAGRTGLESTLSASTATPSDWLATRHWSGTDVLLVFSIPMVAAPIAVLGRYQRLALSYVPYGLALRSSLVAMSLVAASVVSHLPAWLQFSLLLLGLVLLVTAGRSFVLRVKGLRAAWREQESEVVRAAALAELALPGLGRLVLADFAGAVVSLVVSAMVFIGCLVLGPLGLPLYLWRSMNSAQALLLAPPSERAQPVAGTPRLATATVNDDDW